MSEKILIVDDDVNLLAGCERGLRKHFQIETAAGAEAALKKISPGSHAVVVSDRQMPGMDGITFLAKVREIAPDTVRIMLTGNVDLEHAVRVVNEGNIFRFLIKPSPVELLVRTLNDALHQFRLVHAEKELLGKTLNGAIKLMTDMLAALDPASMERADRLRHLVNVIQEKVSLADAWDIHLAVMLSSIGNMTLPSELMVKAHSGQVLSKKEQELVQQLPEISARLLSNIPRLESVAHIVRYQQKQFDGGGLPDDALRGPAIPMGSRLLKILNDLVASQSNNGNVVETLEVMRGRQGWYDPQLLDAILSCFSGHQAGPVQMRTIALKPKQLQAGMILASDITTTDDYLILPTGHMLNETTVEKIFNFAEVIGIKEPIFVQVRETRKSVLEIEHVAAPAPESVPA